MFKPLLQCVVHPNEFSPLLSLRRRIKNAGQGPLMGGSPDADIRFSFEKLRQVSRSFATVIEELGDELRLPVCVFYLVLRALDTIEDDTSIEVTKRIKAMRDFVSDMEPSANGAQPGFWKAKEGRLWFDVHAGELFEKELLEKFDAVGRVMGNLEPVYREVIADIGRKMCEGMAEFAEREVVTVKDYNLYCHYVAGLVGHGLSRLFAASSLEDPAFADAEVMHLSNEMGLFLQKTNIIRDVREDHDESRYFWPAEVTRLYAGSIPELIEPANRSNAVACLNHLVTDALEHAPHCLDYMSRIKDPQNFNFCVIPQVMAAATLAEIYANSAVFDRVVKIRRGMTARLMMGTRSIDDCRGWFRTFAKRILEKVSDSDPNAARTREAVLKVITITEDAQEFSVDSPWWTVGPAVAVAGAAVGVYYFFRR